MSLVHVMQSEGVSPSQSIPIDTHVRCECVASRRPQSTKLLKFERCHVDVVLSEGVSPTRSISIPTRYVEHRTTQHYATPAPKGWNRIARHGSAGYAWHKSESRRDGTVSNLSQILNE